MRRHRGKILAVVSNHVRAWKAGHGLTRLPHHLAADIHRPDFPEKARECPRHPPGATADLQHAHARLRLEQLGHRRDHVRLTDRLAGLDRQCLVRV